jgi:glycosyltransferase involved in cell wall biosynthesis
MNQQLSYVLITPAHNEKDNIENTIKSVVSQTILPKKWIIVSDGSTDGTDEIVKKYLKIFNWIEFARLPEHRNRSFAAKVTSFNAGYKLLNGCDYDVIGNLDADISFESDYFEFLLKKFYEIKDLGVAGTPFIENGYSTLTDSFEGEAHVAGGCQLFRRQCFEEVGGYIPHRSGGIDWIAVTTARMKGWATRSFREKVFFHHRSLGTAQRSKLSSTFDYGKKDYYLGGHPIWEISRVIYRMTKKPYIIGGIVLISGYFWGYLTRVKRPVSNDLMAFHRKEQMQKLKLIAKMLLSHRSIDNFKISSNNQNKRGN